MDSPVEKPKKVVNVYEYSKDWTAHDFYGKYHIPRIKNPIPVPGTQIRLEIEHNEKKNADIQRYEKERELKLINNQKTLELKKQSTEFTTRVHVHTLIGEPSDQAEKILQENYEIATKKVIFPDTQPAIDRFMKNIRLGRAHYVSYAVTTGYRSINWQTQDQLGYTALHLAIVKGYVDVVHELLKYNADTNIRSSIGNYPLHDCWVFWKSPVKHDQRHEQYKITCELLRHLCSYGANPDCYQVSTGATPLHIASRLGPIHAVILLLGFKANHQLRNKDNQTCLDVAREYGNEEIARVLEYWSCIKSQLVHVDFIIQWKIFLNDPEAQISSITDKSVESILFELRMKDNMRQQDSQGEGRYLFPVDDDFLLQCKLERSIIEKLKNQHKFIEKNDNENDNESKDSVGRSGSSTERSYEPGSWQSMTGYGKKKVGKNSFKKKKLPPVREYYLKILAANSPAMPDDKNPELRKKNYIARLPSNVIIEEEDEEDDGEDTEKEEEEEEEEDEEDEEEKEKEKEKEEMEVEKKEANGEREREGDDNSSSRNELSSFSSIPDPNQDQDQGQDKNPHQSDKKDEEEEVVKPKTSQLLLRRKMMASRITLDGKFENYTTRPCTSSILHLSRRSEDAPLEKTLEEYSLLRYLTTPTNTRKLLAGNKYDLSKKELKKIELLQSTKSTKNISSYGSYINGLDYTSKKTQRQLLYDRLAEKNSLTNTGTSVDVCAATTTSTSLTTQESYKGKKIDMNMAENRSLFVSKELIPKKKELKILDELKNKIQTEIKMNGQEFTDEESVTSTNSSSSSSVMALYGLKGLQKSQGQGEGQGEGDLVDTLELLQQEKELKEKQKKLNYHQDRLSSTYQMKRIVEEPWSRVKGNYQIPSLGSVRMKK